MPPPLYIQCGWGGKHRWSDINQKNTYISQYGGIEADATDFDKKLK